MSSQLACVAGQKMTALPDWVESLLQKPDLTVGHLPEPAVDVRYGVLVYQAMSANTNTCIVSVRLSNCCSANLALSSPQSADAEHIVRHH